MINNKKVLAVALARGGSKGVPGKNIKDLCGKPLVHWVIEAAQRSKYVDRVILSTDDENIARAGRTCGAEVPFMRPSELAEDDTPDMPVFKHALAWLEEHETYTPNILVHLRPTGPLVTGEEIDEALALLEKYPEADSVRSVKEPPKSPFKMWRVEGEYMKPFATVPGLKDSHTMPRQLLPAVYQTTPDIGVFRIETLVNKQSIIGDNVLPFILKRESVDIDTLFDFKIAEMLMRREPKE